MPRLRTDAAFAIAHHPHACLAAFCCGVVALRFWAVLPAVGVAVAAAIVMLVVAVRSAAWRLPAAFVIGFCWANVTAASVLARELPAALEKRDVQVIGRIVGAPALGASVQRFEFEVAQLHYKGKRYPSPGRIKLKWYAPAPPIRSGAHWQLSVRLKKPRGYQNLGATFDRETHLFARRIRASGYVRNHPPPKLLRAPDASLDALRARIAEFIRTELPPVDTAGLIAALTVGIRNDMNAHTWDVLLRTGTIHLVAISGLHVGLVSGLVMALCAFAWRFAGRLPLRLPAPKAGVLGGLMAGVMYALLAGMTVPTQRAVCMLAVIAAAMLVHRRAFGWETWLTALSVVLVFDPLAPMSSGLWLSFGAVAAMMYGAAKIRGARAQGRVNPTANIKPRRNVVFVLLGWALVQWVLFIGMAPLILTLFQRVSLVAPLANLIAVPVVGLLAVPLALIGLGLYVGGYEPGAVMMFECALWILQHLWRVLEWMASREWSVWQQPPPPIWSLPFAALGAMLLLARKAMPMRWLGVLLLLPMLTGAPKSPPLGAFHYTMLDVGNGLASVVQTRNHLLVYDAGPNYPGFDSGESIVAPFIRQLGIRRIDALVVSHGDNDHAGGHRALLRQFPTTTLLAGESLDEPKGESQGESSVDSKGESQGKSPVESKGESQDKSSVESKGESKNKSLVESKGELKNKPRVESKGESKGESSVDSKGESKDKSLVESKGKSQDKSSTEAHAESKSKSPVKSPAESNPHPRARRCRAGQRWVWDEVHFEMLSPLPRDSRRGNEASCVLRVHSANGALLLTGDIGKPAESALVRAGANLSADVLQSPHHGSKTSSTELFLARVNPSVALASAGYLNRFGHPNAEVRARHERRNILLYTTAAEGAITAAFTAEGIVIRGQRANNLRYWAARAQGLRSAKTFHAKSNAVNESATLVNRKSDPPQPPNAASKLDALHRINAAVKRMLNFFHFGDGVGNLDNFGRGVAAGED